MARIVKRVLANFLLIVIPFILLEIVFRFLPVSYPPYILPVSPEYPIARFQPNKDYLYSVGWNFAIRAKKRSNNFGYINQDDYDPDERSPLLMVIGDSYVEANQVDVGKSASEIIGSRVRGEGRVYSIGLSGAPLSQYLAFAEYSKITFQPNAMVFVIISNDFDESLLKYKNSPRFHLFKEQNDDFVLQRVDYNISDTKKFLRKFALIRYIMLNLEVKSRLERFLNREPANQQVYMGNVPIRVEKQRISDSMKAVDEFFSQLPLRSGLDVSKILFVMDGNRPALYSQDTIEKAESSFWGQMRQYFAKQALSLGYEVIDMQPVFIMKNRLDNSRFEFDIDGHWNELGHLLVAKEIENSSVFKFAITKINPLTKSAFE